MDLKLILEIPLNIENDSNANVMHCMATALDCFEIILKIINLIY